MLRVRYRLRWKGIHFESQVKHDPYKISMASIIMGDREHDHCIFIRASAFMWSTWWSCMGTGENSLARAISCAACAIPIFLLSRENTGSVVEIEKHAPRFLVQGWSSQDQHGQYHNGWSWTRALHLKSKPERSSVQHDEDSWEMVSISLTREITCAAFAVPTLLLRWKHRGSVVEMEMYSLRISDLGWFSQDRHGH